MIGAPSSYLILGGELRNSTSDLDYLQAAGKTRHLRMRDDGFGVQRVRLYRYR